MFHGLHYWLKKIGVPMTLRFWIFDVGEGYEDAANRFPEKRNPRALHRFYRGLGRGRLVSYSIGYVIGSLRRPAKGGTVLDLAEGLEISRAAVGERQ